MRRLVRWWLLRQSWAQQDVDFFKQKGWAVVPYKVWQHDAQRDALAHHGNGVRAGRDLGVLEILRYTEQDQRWQDIRKQFKYDELNAKYQEGVGHGREKSNERTSEDAD